jgi:hypothetical protein
MNIIADPSHGPIPRLTLTVDKPLIAHFFLLLQQGVKIRRRVGCNVDTFLQQEIGAAPETIEKIQSIILDGKPVDDVGSSLLHDGSTLALSAAMPGLVGATLRRGGAYSSFRSGITYHETEKTCAPGDGWVNVKIFNLLMRELGPGILQTGIFLRSSDLLAFLTKRAAEFQQGCSALLDNKPIAMNKLEGDTGLAGNDQVFLIVAAGQAKK